MKEILSAMFFLFLASLNALSFCQENSMHTVNYKNSSPTNNQIQDKSMNNQKDLRDSPENNNTIKNILSSGFTVNIGNKRKLEMVLIPKGSFLMGTNDTDAKVLIEEMDRHGNELKRYRPEFTPQEWASYEQPVHKVNVPTFYLSKYEVTQAQWYAVMGYNPSYFQGDDLPVEQVSWNEAIEFCQKLSKQTGHNYRLPSEAEWEYACRANTSTPFAFGQTIDIELANYAYQYPDVYSAKVYSPAPEGTTPVGSFMANAFGLHDMHGNVLEWCQDIWHPNYLGAPTDGSAWLTNGNPNKRVFRGGSFVSYAFHSRSAVRERWDINVRNNFTGFRVAMSVADSKDSLKNKNTIKFYSDKTWLVFDQNQDPRESQQSRGYAQAVKVNDHIPQFAPKDAVSYNHPASDGWLNLRDIPEAQWIWAPRINGNTPNADLQGFFFVKNFELPVIPVNATISIAVDDFAEVIINNQRVCTIGSITDVYVAARAQQGQSFDITQYLVKGTNSFIIRAKNGPSSFALSNKPCSYSENPAGVVFGGYIVLEEENNKTEK